MRDPSGGYSERHLPINEKAAYTLTARDRDKVLSIEGDTDASGVAAPNSRSERVRARLSRWMYEHNVQKPTAAELQEAHHHNAHEAELQSGLDHPVDGHQFDDHRLRDADDVPLRD
jgi:ubiquinol-cytochrome c reductase cytochrome b subunit